MKFAPCHCPQCGKAARGTVDVIAGIALLESEDDESFEWAGETEVNWDSQETVRGSGDCVLLTCSEGHEWLAEVVGDPFPGDTWLQGYIARLKN